MSAVRWSVSASGPTLKSRSEGCPAYQKARVRCERVVNICGTYLHSNCVSDRGLFREYSSFDGVSRLGVNRLVYEIREQQKHLISRFISRFRSSGSWSIVRSRERLQLRSKPATRDKATAQRANSTEWT